MAHVVVDQTEGKASVHESQAPLGRQTEKRSERTARNPGCEYKKTEQKTNTYR